MAARWAGVVDLGAKPEHLMRLFKIALPLLFAGGIAVAASRTWMDTQDRAARALAAEHARSEFVQHAALVRAQPDGERYRLELRALMRTWFASQAALGNRWPALRTQLAPFIAAQRAPAQLQKDVDELLGGTLTALREGRLEMLSTAVADGLRIDVLRVTRLGKGDDARLQIDVAVWGGPEETTFEESGDRSVTRTTVPVVFRGLSFKFFDAAAKQIAHMPGEGQPRLRVDLPEGLMADAPPGLVLGRYEPFLFPKDAAEVEWTVNLWVKMPSGENRPANAIWKTKMDPSWADATGKVWSAPDTVSVEGEAEPKPSAKR